MEHSLVSILSFNTDFFALELKNCAKADSFLLVFNLA